MMVQCHVNRMLPHQGRGVVEAAAANTFLFGYLSSFSLFPLKNYAYFTLSPFLCAMDFFGLSIYDKSACIMRQFSICQIPNVLPKPLLCLLKKKLAIVGRASLDVAKWQEQSYEVFPVAISIPFSSFVEEGFDFPNLKCTSNKKRQPIHSFSALDQGNLDWHGNPSWFWRQQEDFPN